MCKTARKPDKLEQLYTQWIIIITQPGTLHSQKDWLEIKILFRWSSLYVLPFPSQCSILQYSAVYSIYIYILQYIFCSLAIAVLISMFTYIKWAWRQKFLPCPFSFREFTFIFSVCIIHIRAGKILWEYKTQSKSKFPDWMMLIDHCVLRSTM